MSITSSLKSEYWYHVSDQNEIPIFGTVERSVDIELLKEIVDHFPNNESNREYIQNVIKRKPDAIDLLRQFVGVTDKRMYLELSYVFAKRRQPNHPDLSVLGYSIYDLKKHSMHYFKNLMRHTNEIQNVASGIITDYLISKGLFAILNALKSLEFEQLPAFVDALITTKEVQQAETKRRGHGAEQQFAILLNELGVSFLPEGKHINPMSADDPNVDKRTFTLSQRDEKKTWSFDVIIKNNEGNMFIFTQGLIHTSDPGQYGVNKSGETILVRQSLDDYNLRNNSHCELWGLVDGVGFVENPDNTIFKMLPAFDNFVQLKSLYKTALRLHKLGIIQVKAIRFDSAFYTQQDAQEMFNKYGSPDIVFLSGDEEPNSKKIQAGKAWVYI